MLRDTIDYAKYSTRYELFSGNLGNMYDQNLDFQAQDFKYLQKWLMDMKPGIYKPFLKNSQP